MLGSCNIGELHCRIVAVWGELRCGELRCWGVVVWENCCVREMWCELQCIGGLWELRCVVIEVF